MGRHVATPLQSPQQEDQFELLERKLEWIFMAIYLVGKVGGFHTNYPISQLPNYKLIRCLNRNGATLMQSICQNGQFKLAVQGVANWYP